MLPCPARRREPMGAASREHRLRSGPGTHRSGAGGGEAGGLPGSSAASASRPPPSTLIPQGEEQLMGTCDFFHQWT